MAWLAEVPITNTEPCVQRLVIGPYRETGVGPQGLAGAGLSVFCSPAPAEPNSRDQRNNQQENTRGVAEALCYERRSACSHLLRRLQARRHPVHRHEPLVQSERDATDLARNGVREIGVGIFL